MIIRELITRWGFDADTDAVQKFEDRLRQATQVAAAVGAAAAASATAIADLGRRAADRAKEVANQSEALDITRQKYQELVFAFRRYKLESDDVSDAMATVTDRMKDVEQGAQGPIDDFEMIGISLQQVKDKNPGELWDLFVEKMGETENASDRVAAAARILGDDLARKLNPLLQGGTERLEKLAEVGRKTGNIWDNETITAGRELGKTIARLRENGRGLWRFLQAKAIPIVQGWADRIMALVQNNRELIKQRLEVTLENVVYWLEAMWNIGATIVDWTNDTIEAFGGLNDVLEITRFLLLTLITYQIISNWSAITTAVVSLAQKVWGLVGALSMANVQAVLVPAAIAALIVLLGYVIEDFYRFFNGQKSAIGELVKEYPKLGIAIRSVADTFRDAQDIGADFLMWLLGPATKEGKSVFTRTGHAIGDFFFELFHQDIPGAWDSFVGWLEQKGADLKSWWHGVGQSVEDFFVGAKDSAKKAIMELIDYMLEKSADAVGQLQKVAGYLPGGAGEKLAEVEGQLRAMIEAGNQAPATAEAQTAGGGGRYVQNKYQFLSDMTVQQQPGEDGEAFARRTADEQQTVFDQQMRETDDHFDGGEEY